jgi:hypothetical protein
MPIHAPSQTVVHYGMSGSATFLSMEVVKLCTEAHASSHLYGKRVRLDGLKTEAMNGQVGFCRGYDCETKRRAVYLPDLEKEMGIKPENLKLLEQGDEETKSERPKLVDIQDRLGSVALHELIVSLLGTSNISQQSSTHNMPSRENVATVLLKDLKARVDIEDCDKHSPLSMVMRPMDHMLAFNPVVQMIKDATVKQGRKEKTEESSRCRHCGKSGNVTLSDCARCKKVAYCNKECQTIDWKERHKQECEEWTKRVTIRPDDISGMPGAGVTFLHSSRTGEINTGLGIKRPRSSAIGEDFYIKIQCNGPEEPLMIYDKTRECQFMLPSTASAHAPLFKIGHAEKATNGRKTYMKASVDKDGNMQLKLNSFTLKRW